MSFLNPKQNLLNTTFNHEKVGQSNGKQKQREEQSIAEIHSWVSDEALGLSFLVWKSLKWK